MNMNKIAAATLVLLSGLAQAQLQGRDLNGDGSFDAYYDSAQNISWLADANYYLTQGGNPAQTNPYMPSIPLRPGEVRYSTALSWAAGLEVYGLSDWRLPQRLVPAGGDSPYCNATSCAPTALWPSELGGLVTAMAGAPSPFVNLQNGYYMTSTSGGWLEYRSGLTGYTDLTNETSLFYGYVLAVHNGDVGALISAATTVAPVPEPETYALMLAGFAFVSVATRRRALGKTGNLT